MNNRTIYANDCLEVLSDSNALPNESIDLIYLDPPFDSNSEYNLPFKGQYKKDTKPVMVFKDTWSWSENEVEILSELNSGDLVDRMLGDIIEMSKRIFKEKPNAKISTSAYLLNMAIRLKPMKRVLKNTGNLFLHCDPKASHYLKMILDVIFNRKNFKNEIIWCYKSGGASPKRHYSRKHDVIFWYSKTNSYTFNPQTEKSYNRDYKPYRFKGVEEFIDKQGRWYTVVGMKDYWNIDMVGRTSSERLGYPTQKPLKLLRQIIQSASNEGDFVLDPFCGCGTTLHAAEDLNRQWIGVDISQFSTGLVRNRLIENFKHKHIARKDISVKGCPLTLADAKDLARTDPFEFEKWTCGEVGAEGMFHEPGEKGSDGGVDGVIPFFLYGDLFDDKPPEKTFAVVQVKGGRVHPDAVKALSTTVRESGAKCGLFICFEEYMNTVENNREKKRIRDLNGDFNFIEGLSIESLLDKDSKSDLPYLYRQRSKWH